MQAAKLPPGAPTQCIIKLGGSAITVKSQHETLRQPVLASVCQSIADLHASTRGVAGVVLVHGAGSFGHFEAAQHGVAKGGLEPQQLRGFCLTRQSVAKLNGLVVAALIQAGVPAVGLSPCPNRRVDADAVRCLLAAGFVPVLHGDGVLDAAGVGILSGDAILRQLAVELQPSWCTFLTDVEGLFSAPPDVPGATLIPAVDVASDGSWTVPHGLGAPELRAAAHDTTGGIAAKVAEAAAVALAGPPVAIAQAGSAAGAATVLRGPAALSSGSCGGLRGTTVRRAAAGDS